MEDNVSDPKAQVMANATGDMGTLLVDALKSLKEVVAIPSTPEAKRFCPHGIGLLYLKAEAGLNEKTKLTLELKIADVGQPGATTSGEN